MIIASALVSAAVSLAAADGNLVVEVAKKGNVSWTGDCTLEITPKAADAPPVGAVKPDQEVPLSPGDYLVAVACPTTEGIVKRYVKHKQGARDGKVNVVLEPGFLIVFVQRFDSPVAAEVRITDIDGNELAVTKERAVVPLAPGKVRVIAKVEDAKASRPVLGNAETTILPMKKGEVTVDTTDGELTVLIQNNGAKAAGVGWLRVPGDPTHLVELRAGEKASVPPGTYEMVTQLEDAHDFGEVVTPNVVIPPKKAVSKTATHRTATVAVNVLVDGRAPPPGAKIDVDLYQPGQPQPFNTVALGEKLKLKPGKIDVAAKRTDSKLDDGTALYERKSVNVTGNTTVAFDLRIAHLDVVTTVGRKPRALEVSVRLPPAKDGSGDAEGNVLAQKKTGEDGKASFAMSPARYVVFATLKAPQGEIATKKEVTLRGGNTVGLTMDLDVGTANVQVLAKGVAVPAEVRFLEKAKDGKVASEPILAVPAGQEAMLPPGTYAVVVKRKGKETPGPDVVVVPGGVVDKSVEVPE